MTLSPIRSVHEAEWLDPVDVLSGTVGGLFPVPFEYVVAVEHRGHTGTLPEARATELTQALMACSDPSQTVFYCIWDGWGASVYRSDGLVALSRGWWRRRLPRSDGDRPGLAHREIPHRTYFVFEGALRDATVNHNQTGFQSASMWWPADRRWFVATEVDAEATYIGLKDESCLSAVMGIGAQRVEHSEPMLTEPLPREADNRDTLGNCFE